MTNVTLLDQWRLRAEAFETALNRVIVGQERAIRLLTIALLARGHVLLEGAVGVGKTTLLRAAARAMGGGYSRIEGAVDLMPADLIYHAHLDAGGRPAVEPGPLLAHGERLAVFFFNEINRARPQVHALLLGVMAERRVTAFNREWAFPHLTVFADRNRVEKEETFELPAAARDRFMLEIPLEAPQEDSALEQLFFDPRYHDPDRLIAEVAESLLPHDQLYTALALQDTVQTAPRLRSYAVELWRATHDPARAGIELPDVDMDALVQVGISPRGMSHLIRAARVRAWLHGRDMVLPEDLQELLEPVCAHRIFLQPVYELRRAELAPELVRRVVRKIPAP